MNDIMADDPFYIVKDELRKSVTKIRTLIERYNTNKELKSNIDQNQQLVNDINTTIKSVEWDIQDLEETINIAEKNPQKFKLTLNELEERRKYINNTKEYIQKTKDSLQQNTSDATKSKNIKSTSIASSVNAKMVDLLPNTKAKYTRLKDDESADEELDTNKLYNQKQEQLFKQQDKHLDVISDRVASLKEISQTMNTELESQSVLLNELDQEFDTAENRMQVVMKKLTKLLHISTDRQQWIAIGVLLGIILVLIILFNVIPSKQ